MPEGPEIETNELQERVHEAHHHHEDHTDVPSWVRTVSLSTAILAVFAAVGALQAGRLVNEATISQIKASDAWNEYQASREKSHLYTVGRNLLADLGPKSGPAFPAARLSEYKSQIDKEDGKAKELSEKAKKLEEESNHEMHHHERFAYEVAMLQVAIALGAVSALTKVKSVWMLSMAIGLIGVVLFILGFLN